MTIPIRQHIPWTDTLLKLIIGGLIARTLVAIWLFPGFDEAYYYLYSRHLSWSYFDHPVMVALTTGVGWWLTGIISPLTIRIGALLLYCLSLWLLYRVATRMFSPAAGQMTIALVTLMPLLTIGFGILTSPDNGLILFWSATLLVAAWEFFPLHGSYLRHGWNKETYTPSWRLALLGVTVGLACLSKYHGFVLGLSLVGFCLTCHPYRRALISPWILVALLLFIITLFPLWYWNSQHDWISFRFQLLMRFDGNGGSSSFNPLQMVGYWLISIAYLFPLLGFPLWWVTFREMVRQVQFYLSPTLSWDEAREHHQRFLILWLSLPIMVGFTLLGGKQQIFPAWPAPGYWGISMLLAAQAVTWQRQRPRLIGRWLWGSGLFLGPLLAIALLHLQLGLLQQPGNYSLFGGFVPVEQDGSTELIDTGQLNRRIAAAPAVMAALNHAEFVFTNEYYLGGYLDMAIHPLVDVPVTAFSQDPRGFAFWFNQQDWLGGDALYITLARFVDDPTILEAYEPLFDSIEPLTSLSLERGGEVTETFYLFKARHFQEPYEYPY
jgi:4-amino-4-deoxy-L-arabinose transferase-like glycosyltransferase